MYIYFIVLFLASIAAFFFDITKKKIFWIISLVIVVAFAGLRYYVGIDYESYTLIFLTIADSSTEPAFRLINLIISVLGLNVQWVFIISSFITFLLFYKGIEKYSTDIFLSVFLLLFCGFFVESLNIVRQYIAISLFFYSIQYVVSKNFAKYIFWILLAACFHYSAILLIAVYFILDIEVGKWWYLILFVAFVLPFVFPIASILGLIPGYDVYFSSTGAEREDNGSANLGIGFLSKLLIGGVCLYYYDRIIDASKESRLFLNGFFVYLFLLSFFRDFIVMVRLGYYFHIFLILLIPEFVKIFEKKSLPVVYIFILMYGLLILTISISNPETKLIPYDFTMDFLK
ncbi:EpsG family protein [Sphingobacterium multivorum]|uniref:EpsG family protein n=1 Tax=Sphingobacterium multivorum TaxID=28454 RepID=UPI0031B9C02B